MTWVLTSSAVQSSPSQSRSERRHPRSALGESASQALLERADADVQLLGDFLTGHLHYISHYEHLP